LNWYIRIKMKALSLKTTCSVEIINDTPLKCVKYMTDTGVSEPHVPMFHHKPTNRLVVHYETWWDTDGCLSCWSDKKTITKFRTDRGNVTFRKTQ
jgi:hypothetical protein